jgi:hypothetical protein
MPAAVEMDSAVEWSLAHMSHICIMAVTTALDTYQPGQMMSSSGSSADTGLAFGICDAGK